MKKKLTQEVFSRPDCPKWAKWAAVDIGGNAYWYEEKPTLGYTGTFWMAKRGTKCMRISDKFSYDVTLLERKQTNLDWLYEHPEELAKELIREDPFQAFHTIDGERFIRYKDAIEHVVSWLKQEHKEK